VVELKKRIREADAVLVVTPKYNYSDRILGITVFGAEASELMAVVQTAMLGELPYTVLRDAIFTHQTAAEGLTGLLADVGTETTHEFAPS
jgi:pyruvate/2-oxoglutarate dehydrogenase complex dihydrolipoamide dehydrogenase (E3) component